MSDEALSKLRRLSRMIKMLIIVISCLVALGSAYLILQPIFDWAGFRSIIRNYLMIGSRQITPTPFSLAGLALISVANAVLVLYGLRSIWQLFNRFERGDVFSPASGTLLRRAGLIVLCGAVSMVLSRTASILLLTYANPPGQRMLALNFGTSEAMLILVSGLLFVMGHVMTIATEIDVENRSII